MEALPPVSRLGFGCTPMSVTAPRVWRAGPPHKGKIGLPPHRPLRGAAPLGLAVAASPKRTVFAAVGLPSSLSGLTGRGFASPLLGAKDSALRLSGREKRLSALCPGQLLRPLLTSVRSFRAVADSVARWQADRPPRVSHLFFARAPPDLPSRRPGDYRASPTIAGLPTPLGLVSGFCSSGPGLSSSASFRFHLTMDTLA